jgi:2-phosphoglycerate kinase
VSERRHGELHFLGGTTQPYSKGLMARVLTAVGVPVEPAYELARRTEADLAERGATSVDLDRLRELAVDVLGESAGNRAVRRLRQFRDLQELDVPVIVLVGGGTGTGKSTVATEVAYRLGITRVTSTDFVRQTMRAFFSEAFMPSIHYSSFEAGIAVAGPDEDPAEANVRGFLEQTRNVLVGVRASVERALTEGHSMAIEGVHLVPGLVPAAIEGAIVCQCVIAIPDEEAHMRHFYVRDLDSDGLRPVQKYLAALPEIRRIQDVLVDRALETGVPVIANGDKEQAVDAVPMRLPGQ